MLTLQGIIVLVVIAFIILSLYLNIIGSGFTFTIGIILLGMTGILTPKEILAGFANEQIAVIVMLLIIADIIRKSGALDNMFRKAFEGAKTYRQYLSRMTIIVAGFSSFVNNTPLVAIMMPYVSDWSRKNGVSVSKLMIPLSYAAILGGCATLIGTSTNLVVNSLVIDQQIIPGLQPLGIFDFTLVGVTMILFGGIYMVFFGNKLLPTTKDNIEEISANSREYIAEVRVINKSNIVGQTIEEAGLRNLSGLFLVEILRGGDSIAPVTPKTRLLADDVLMFAGNTDTISDFVTSKKGLQLAQIGMFAKKAHTEIVEVVVPYNSTLVTKSVKETNFRRKFDAAIIAVHRNGERISGKIGEVRLMAGDALLLITGEDFYKTVTDSSDLYLINNIKEFQINPWYKNFIMIGGLVTAILLASTGLVSLFITLISLIILLMVLGYASPKDIAKGVDFNLIIVIALSLALGTAMVKTGVADVVSHYTFEMLAPWGIVGIFAGIYLLTNLLGSIITNKAAVALVLPIALTLSINFELNPKPFVLLVAFAGAASFLTPIGYQTNLMVYGPGRYTFKDYFRIGLPLTIIYMVVAVLLLIWQYGIRLN